jgi:hypothetical protein
MSLYVFVTLCIIGSDFLIYVLYQWTFGDKRRAMVRKIAAHRNAARHQPGLTPVQPIPISSSRRQRAEVRKRTQIAS